MRRLNLRRSTRTNSTDWREKTLKPRGELSMTCKETIDEMIRDDCTLVALGTITNWSVSVLSGKIIKRGSRRFSSYSNVFATANEANNCFLIGDVCPDNWTGEVRGKLTSEIISRATIWHWVNGWHGLLNRLNWTSNLLWDCHGPG